MTTLSYWRGEVRGACHAIRTYRLAVGKGMWRPSHQEYSRLCMEVHKARRRYKIELKAALHEQRRAA